MPAPRVQGPAEAAPQPIQPRPFVDPAKLTLPPAPVAETTETPGTEDGVSPSGDLAVAEAGDGNAAVPDAQQHLNAQPAEAGQDQADDTQTTGAGLVRPGYEEATLASFDPSLQAAPNAPAARGQATATLFEGLSRDEAIAVLDGLGAPTGSLSLRAFARDVALGAISAPPSVSDADIAALYAARLRLLRALGSVSGYTGLIESLPRDRDWPALARQISDAYLVSARLSEACALADARREDDADIYWVEIAVFCAAAQGDRISVDFQLDILDTLTAPDANFVALADQILLVAEAERAGSAPPQATALDAPLKATPLHVAMTRLAGARVTALDEAALDPLAVEALIRLPGLDDALRAQLLRASMARGVASVEVMRAFVSGAAIGGTQPVAADTEAGVFAGGAIDLIAVARLLSVLGTDQDIALRLRDLETLWDSAVAAGLELQIAPLLAGATNDIAPQPLERTQAAILARAHLIAGHTERAFDWFVALRSSAAGRDLARDTATAELVPLLVAAGVLDAGLLPSDFTSWWPSLSGETADQTALKRAGLLLSLVEAQGRTVPERLWARLEAQDTPIAGLQPQPARWRAFLISVARGYKASSLKSAFQMVADYGMADVPSVVMGSLNGGLHRQGLGALADQLGLEALIAAGL